MFVAAPVRFQHCSPTVRRSRAQRDRQTVLTIDPNRQPETPTKESSMPSRTVKVASRVGLHARPASLFVQAVTATGLPVTIAKTGGDPVDARSILMVMGLGVGNDDEVTLTAEGDGADDALDQLVELLEIDHDAP
jgi:phosphocarrier protein